MGTALKIYNEDGASQCIKYGTSYSEMDSADLHDTISWNDSITSLEVYAGYYVNAFEEVGFIHGRIVLPPGVYSNDKLKDMGWQKKISSLKTYTRCAAIIYKDDDCKGNAMIVSGDITSLDDIDFNNSVKSIKVMPGYKVKLYAADDFQEYLDEFSNDNAGSGKNLAKDDKGKCSSIQVIYEFGVEINSGETYSGTSHQLSAGNSNTSSYGGLRSMKVNPGYKVELFAQEYCDGTPIAVYTGPCDIEKLTVQAASIRVTSGCYAVRAYDGHSCTGSHIDLYTSVRDFEIYGDWNNKIRSMEVASGYFVQICEDTGFAGDRIVVSPVNGRVDFDDNFADGLSDWDKKISSIRITKQDVDAVYLFENETYGGNCVKLINEGTTSHHHWYWDGDDGREHHVSNDELSSVLIVGNFKVTLYEDADTSDGDNMTLYGPGFFDLTAKANEDTVDKELFNDKATKLNIASYTPHSAVMSEVRGYNNLILLRGDLHNHTFWSDAYWGGSGGVHYIDDPQQTFRIYQALGYDFDGISDHVFGSYDDGDPRYVLGYPRCAPLPDPNSIPRDENGKCAISPDEWKKTMWQAARPEHNYSFSSIAGYEYCLGGTSLETSDHENETETVAHYNVFGTDNIYYGKPGLWHNTKESRKDFYSWAADEYEDNPGTIVQFNHPSNEGEGFNDFEDIDLSKTFDQNGVSNMINVFALQEVYSVSSDGDDEKFWLKAYEKALKKGWKVGPTATSDNHDGIKSIKVIYENIRTVAAANESSKEAVLDALRKRRVYATRIPGLSVGFSITNSANETVIMGGDIARHNGALSIDIGLSGSLDRDSGKNKDAITAVEIRTNSSSFSKNVDSSTTWPLYIPCTLTAEQLDGVKYIFVTVISKKFDKQNSAITAPIWITD